jgi:hypothetical protein
MLVLDLQNCGANSFILNLINETVPGHLQKIIDYIKVETEY